MHIILEIMMVIAVFHLEAPYCGFHGAHNRRISLCGDWDKEHPEFTDPDGRDAITH